MTKQYSLEQIDQHWTAVHQATLVFVVNDNEVLLIRKKRGLGAGKINGPGGKLDPGESVEACARREVLEELCIELGELRHGGRLRFQFVDDYSIDVAVFLASEYSGVPTETDEAEPLWFAKSEIPYEQMWADDIIWLPRVLAGESVNGRFIFDEDAMLDHHVDFTKH